MPGAWAGFVRIDDALLALQTGFHHESCSGAKKGYQDQASRQTLIVLAAMLLLP